MSFLLPLSEPTPAMVLPHTKKTTNARRNTGVVISYNVAACQHIQNGEYDRSIKLIATAIRLFKKSAVRARSEEQTREDSTKTGGAKTLASVDAFMTSFPTVVDDIVGREGHHDYCQIEPSKSDDSSGNHENVTAYRMPIQLPTTLGDNGGDGDLLDSVSLAILPPILFFNLALAHHLKGTQIRQTSFLAKAATLYESAFRLERIRCQKHNLFSSPLFLASLLNNIGHIHQQRRQFQEYTSSPIETLQSSSSSTPPINTPEVVYFQRLFTMLTYLAQSRRICRSAFLGFFENCVAGMSTRKCTNCAGAA